MIYLLLNVVFASTFTLLIKLVHVRNSEDIVTVGAINYIVAAFLVLPEFIADDVSAISTFAVATGGTMGTCYFIAFFFVIQAVRRIGASSATVIGGLSILLPIACGALLWNEQPNSYQTAGIVLAIFALSLIGRHGRAEAEGRPWLTPVILVSFFLLAGVARLTQGAFKHGSEADQRPTFLITAFVVAAIPSIGILAYRKLPISLLELVLGFAMGSANILQLHFTLKALQHLPGFIVFPIGSAGCLIMTALVATRLLGERLSRGTYVGIAVASIALVLLNWLP
jgi:drug/metabolite transporter (DMT)-like permease